MILLLALALQQDTTSYFPLDEGASWTYATSVGQDMTVRIEKYETVSGVRCALVVTTFAGKTNREWLSRDGGGLRLYRLDDTTLNPPLLRLPASVQDGQSWTVGETKCVARTGRALRIGTVEFACLQVTATTKDVEIEYWFAAGVGMVKQVYRQSGREIWAELRPRVMARFEEFRPERGTGRILVSGYAATSAKAALRSALRDLGLNATVCSAIADDQDREAEAWIQTEKERGVVFVRVHPAGASVVAMVDARETFLESLPALVKMMPAAPVWRETALSSGSGRIRLPSDWTVTFSNAEGTVGAQGTTSRIDLGAFCTVWTPEAAAQLYARPPLVASYGDPAKTAAELTPQFSELSVKSGGPTVKFVKLVEQSPADWMPGKSALMLYEFEMGGVPWMRLELATQMPNGDGSYVWYSSSVSGIKKTWALDLPILLEIWGGWKVSEKVYHERLRKAAKSLADTTQIILDVTAYRREAFERSHAKWCEYIRGKATVVDSTTGKPKEVPIHEAQKFIDEQNRAAGYQKWSVIPAGQLN